MVSFTPYERNPIFSGTDTDTWDRNNRERGYILQGDGKYKMWYSGYLDKDTDPKYLGYATSDDSIHWTRYPCNPNFDKKWTKDKFIIKKTADMDFRSLVTTAHFTVVREKH